MKDIEKDVDSWMSEILESSNKPVFTKITLDEKTAKQYNLLSKIKIGPEYKGIIYLDNDNIIGYANVNKSTKIIQVLKVNKKYDNEDNYKALIDIAVNELGANISIVSKNNDALIGIYEECGFHVFNEVGSNYYMMLKFDCQNHKKVLQDKYGHCCYCCCKERDCACIYNLYVNKEYRKQGHSKRFLKEAIKSIRETGFKKAIQIRPTPEENSISKKDLAEYYKRMGLKVID